MKYVLCLAYCSLFALTFWEVFIGWTTSAYDTHVDKRTNRRGTPGNHDSAWQQPLWQRKQLSGLQLYIFCTNAVQQKTVCQFSDDFVLSLLL